MYDHPKEISCSLCSLLHKPDDELGIGLRRVKGHNLHVALDSSRLTVWNARFCNDGISSHAILFWRSLIVLLFQSKKTSENMKLKPEPRDHNEPCIFQNDMQNQCKSDSLQSMCKKGCFLARHVTGLDIRAARSKDLRLPHGQ